MCRVPPPIIRGSVNVPHQAFRYVFVKEDLFCLLLRMMGRPFANLLFTLSILAGFYGNLTWKDNVIEQNYHFKECKNLTLLIWHHKEKDKEKQKKTKDKDKRQRKRQKKKTKEKDKRKRQKTKTKDKRQHN